MHEFLRTQMNAMPPLRIFRLNSRAYFISATQSAWERYNEAESESKEEDQVCIFDRILSNNDMVSMVSEDFQDLEEPKKNEFKFERKISSSQTVTQNIFKSNHFDLDTQER